MAANTGRIWRQSGLVSPDRAGRHAVFLQRLWHVLRGQADGKLKWEKRLGGICIRPLIGRDGTVYACCKDIGVIAFTPSGRVKWRNRGLKDIQSAPQLGPSGVFYVEANNVLYALNP